MASDIVLTNPAAIAQPGGHYTHAVTANGFVFIAGQLPITPDGAKLAEAPFERQAQLVLDNVASALAGAGSAIDRLVQVRVYVTDIKCGRLSTLSMLNGLARRVRPARWYRCPNCITVSRSKSRPLRWKEISMTTQVKVDRPNAHNNKL
jgi:enamine deaminase RidA (YjgF/YER057c/UK114 family)